MTGQPLRVQQWQRGGLGVYYQTFFNTVNRTLITTKDGWKWAVNDGGDRDNSGRQYGNLSDFNGVTDQGFVYASTGQLRTILTWYEEAPFVNGIALNRLQNISFNIGHTNTNVETRVIIKVDDGGVDKWFTSREMWTHGVGSVENFETQAENQKIIFSELTWSALTFDGLVGSASSGFTHYNNSNLPVDIATPQGTLKGLGLWNYTTGNRVSRFDDFRFTWRR